MEKIDTALLKAILSDKKVRTEVTGQSIEFFMKVYLNHYISLSPAPFHKEMYSIIEDEQIKKAVIVAFRGSGKSTIMNLACPLWAILGKQQKKFVLIVGQTQQQARQHFKNIREELEKNEVLRKDLGPFQIDEKSWSASTLVLPKYNARISVVSMEQSLRGIRHCQFRPDLIICDDIEDIRSVKTRESRNKTYEWLVSEIFPVGEKTTKLIVIGNLLHEDSLVMRLKQSIESNKLAGVFRKYPLLDENGIALWQSKYPTSQDIDELRQSIGNEVAWQREYLLRIISDQDRVVHPEWLHYYQELPSERPAYIITGVDLAISQKESADYTAMVSARVYGSGENKKIYILSNPVNEKLTFPETVNRVKNLSYTLGEGKPTRLIIEDVGYQKSMIQELQKDGLPVNGFQTSGQDKRERLALTTHLIQQGKVVFPEKGVERLIEQLVGFGSEKHDDLADAFAMVVLDIIGRREPTFRVVMLG